MQVSKIIRKNFFRLIFFILSAMFLRFFSFFPSVLDHDESTYMIIGNAILKGKLLYSEVTDTKPVGIFIVYAALQAIFAYSIFLKRLFVAIVVGITCFIIYKVSNRIFKNETAAFASGVIYLFYTSIWIYFGLSPNTELFFNLFTVTGLFFFLKQGKWPLFVAGLMLGVGFMFKYVVLFDFVAFMLFFFIRDILSSKSEFKLSMFVSYVLSGIGFLIPFSVTAIYFYGFGRFDDFYYISFKLPALYKATPSVSQFLSLLGDLLFRFFPITFLFFYVYFKRSLTVLKWQKWFFGIWILFVLIAMFIPGKAFSHYTIQLMLPISLVAGQFFHSDFVHNRIFHFLTKGKLRLLLLSIVIFVIQVAAYYENIDKPDHCKEIAGYLKLNLEGDEQIFVANYESIIYYLLQQESPTKYVHSSMLFRDLHNVFQVDNLAEIKRIMDQKPKFIIVKREDEVVEGVMGDSYLLDCTFRKSNVLVYRLK